MSITEHWIFEKNYEFKNTFLTAPTYFNLSMTQGLGELLRQIKIFEQGEGFNTIDNFHYLHQWEKITENSIRQKKIPFSDALVIKILLSSLPDATHVHLGNSMPVRYANILGCDNKTIIFHSNRGTSGIDGAVSTAMGHAIANNENHLLIVGDMSFFYDRNAWWHNYLQNNFKVVLINNFGGSIFDMIEGTSRLENKQEHYITNQSMCGVHLASEYKIDYHLIKESGGIATLENQIYRWLRLTPSRASILEIQTEQKVNKDVYSSFFI